MLRAKNLFVHVQFMVLLCLLLNFSAAYASSQFAGSPDVGERFLDVRSFAYKIAGKNGWSLIISNDVTSALKEVKGVTVEEALSNYFQKTPFGWRLFENCLYIATERELGGFFKLLPELEAGLPKGKVGASVNGFFKRIELSFLCRILTAVSDVEIRTAIGFDGNIMMRARNISWQRALLAIVYLNRYHLEMTEFSVIISSEIL